MDAGAPEDLFAGAEDEAHFLYDLLNETTRAKSSSYYWEICRTARRRGVTPEYVVDRAAVLLAAMNERRRTDLYRILGVPALASDEMIRQRWLEVAKRHHPDVGGDAAAFRQAKQAYEVLRDGERRGEYERYWLRSIGPFERVAPRDETLIGEVAQTVVREVRAPAVVGGQVRPVAPPEPRLGPRPVPRREAGTPAPVATAAGGSPTAERWDALAVGARLLAGRDNFDPRTVVQLEDELKDVWDVVGRVETALRAVTTSELEALTSETMRMIGELEALGRQLHALETLKQRLGA